MGRVLKPDEVKDWQGKVERYREHDYKTTQLVKSKTQLFRRIKQIEKLGGKPMHTTIDRPVFDDQDLFDRALKIYLRRAQSEIEQGVCFDQPGYSTSCMEDSTYYLRNVNGTLARFRVNASGHLSFAGWGKGRTEFD